MEIVYLVIAYFVLRVLARVLFPYMPRVLREIWQLYSRVGRLTIFLIHRSGDPAGDAMERDFDAEVAKLPRSCRVFFHKIDCAGAAGQERALEFDVDPDEGPALVCCWEKWSFRRGEQVLEVGHADTKAFTVAELLETFTRSPSTLSGRGWAF